MVEIGSVLNRPPEIGERRPPAVADQLKTAARQFETVFLTEMLKHAGVGKLPQGFNGGPGEAAFTDLLTREYAAEISRTGRLGLANSVFSSLLEKAK